MSREIKRTVEINASPEDIFNALITPSMIKKWWYASSAIVIPKENGVYSVSWGENEDDPDYISSASIAEITANKKLLLSNFLYYAKEGGLPFEADFENEFIIEENSGNGSITVIQRGFPESNVADDFYKGCEKGWDDTLSSLKSVLESR